MNARVNRGITSHYAPSRLPGIPKIPSAESKDLDQAAVDEMFNQMGNAIFTQNNKPTQAEIQRASDKPLIKPVIEAHDSQSIRSGSDISNNSKFQAFVAQ